MLHPLPGLKNNIKREDRLTGPLFLWLVRYHTYERQNDAKRPAHCAFHRARYTYPVFPAFPVMHIPVPRRSRRSRWPIARFYPLLPLLAKVGRSGERNIPAPKSAEHPPGAMRDCNLHRLLIYSEQTQQPQQPPAPTARGCGRGRGPQRGNL